MVHEEGNSLAQTIGLSPMSKVATAMNSPEAWGGVPLNSKQVPEQALDVTSRIPLRRDEGVGGLCSTTSETEAQRQGRTTALGCDSGAFH